MMKTRLIPLSLLALAAAGCPNEDAPAGPDRYASGDTVWVTNAAEAEKVREELEGRGGRVKRAQDGAWQEDGAPSAAYVGLVCIEIVFDDGGSIMICVRERCSSDEETVLVQEYEDQGVIARVACGDFTDYGRGHKFLVVDGDPVNGPADRPPHGYPSGHGHNYYGIVSPMPHYGLHGLIIPPARIRCRVSTTTTSDPRGTSSSLPATGVLRGTPGCPGPTLRRAASTCVGRPWTSTRSTAGRRKSGIRSG